MWLSVCVCVVCVCVMCAYICMYLCNDHLLSSKVSLVFCLV